MFILYSVSSEGRRHEVARPNRITGDTKDKTEMTKEEQEEYGTDTKYERLVD